MRACERDGSCASTHAPCLPTSPSPRCLPPIYISGAGATASLRHPHSQVLDHASSTFAGAFYRDLLHGKPVAEAFATAKRVVESEAGNADENATEARKFLLLPEGKDHDEIIFKDMGHPSDLEAARDSLKPRHLESRCSEPVDCFVGRHAVTLEIYKTLHHQDIKVWSVRGVRGIGKTEVVRRALKFSRQRREFDGYFQVDLSDGVRDQDLLGRVHTALLGAAGAHELMHTLSMSSSMDGARNRPMESMLEDIRKKVGDLAEGAVVFIDGCDCISEELPSANLLCDLVEQLARFGNVRVILGGRDLPETLGQGVTHRSITVPPMSPYECAQLFTKRARRNLSHTEMGSNPSDVDPLKAFEQHVIIEACNGHPGTVMRVIECLSGTPNELITCETQLATLASDAFEEFNPEVGTAAAGPRGDGRQPRGLGLTQAASMNAIPSLGNHTRPETPRLSTRSSATTPASLQHHQTSPVLLNQGSLHSMAPSGSGTSQPAPPPPTMVPAAHSSTLPPPHHSDTSSRPGGSSSGSLLEARFSQIDADLRDYPWWKGRMTRQLSQTALKDHPDGTFCVRFASASKVHDGEARVFFSVDFMIQNGKYLPLLVEPRPGNKLLLHMPKSPEVASMFKMPAGKEYNSLVELVMRNKGVFSTPLQ